MNEYLGQVVQQMNQGVAQLNANLRQMGDGAASAINGYYMEAKRFVRAFDEQRGLRYRPATITLSTTVGVGGTGGSADFRVAQNEDFLVMSVRSTLILDMASELAVPSPIGHENATGPVIALHPSERMLMKAQNVRVTLTNKDTKVPIMENEGLSLATFCPEVGGDPLVFGPNVVPAFIIPHNMTIQAIFALQSANALYNGVATNYGVSMTGAYISREVR